MNNLNPKPDPFMQGDRLGATDLNMVRDAVPRQITGADSQVKQYGDRIVIEGDTSPDGKALEIGNFIVLEEFGDYLKCMPFGYDGTTYRYSNTEGAELDADADTGGVVYIAKPPWLQQSQFTSDNNEEENPSVVVNGNTQTYDFTSVNTRTTTQVDSEETETTFDEVITPSYYAGAVITAFPGLTGVLVDGQDDKPIFWSDLNTDGRTWKRLDGGGELEIGTDSTHNDLWIKTETDGAPSGTKIIEVPDASEICRGVVTNEFQEFAGSKTLYGSFTLKTMTESDENASIGSGGLGADRLEMSLDGVGSQFGASLAGFIHTYMSYGSPEIIAFGASSPGYEFVLSSPDTYDLGDGYTRIRRPVFAITGQNEFALDNELSPGVWGSDPVGNFFGGGICLNLGGLSTSGSAVPSTAGGSFKVTAGTITMPASFNMNAPTRSSAGHYVINFAIAYADSDHFWWTMSAVGDELEEVSRTVSSITIVTKSGSDVARFGIAVFGSVSLASGGGPVGTGTATVTLTPNLALVAINAPFIDLYGTGFSATAANDSVTFSTLGAVASIESASPPPGGISMRANFTTPPSTKGVLMARVTISGTSSTTQAVATIIDAPTITASATPIGRNTVTILINGTGFDYRGNLDNIVTFTTLGAEGTVTDVNRDGTQLRVTLYIPPGSNGDLNAKVNSFGGDSNTARVAIVSTTGPTVTLNTANLEYKDDQVTIFGTGFDSTPSNNTVVFNNGTTGTVSSVGTGGTFLSITGLTGLVEGPLTAVVTVGGVSSGAPIQVGTVIRTISRIALGTVTSLGAPVSTLTKRVTTQSGLLIINVSRAAANWGGFGSATFRGRAMTQAVIEGNGTNPGILTDLYYIPVNDEQGDIVFSVALGGTLVGMSVVNVIGLIHNTQDIHATNTNVSGAPDTGATASPTSQPDSYAQAGVVMRASRVGAWTNSFISGQTVSIGKSILSAEAYRILSYTTTVDAAMTGITADVYAIYVVVFN